MAGGGARVAVPAAPVPRSGNVAKPGRAPVAKGPAARDPRFQKLLAQVQANAMRQKAHPSAAQKAAEAQAAAKPPANEKAAGAKANQVEAMKEAKAEKPKTDGFLALLRAEIEKVMPRTLDDTQHFMEGGQKEGAKNAVKGGVSSSKAEATGPTEAATAAPPNPGGIPDRAPTAAPADPPAPTQPVDSASAVPEPKPAAAVSQQAKADEVDRKMKENEVTDTQIGKANDPRFSAVADAKKDVKTKVAAAPGQYRQAEKAALAQGVAKAGAAGKAGLTGMVTARGAGATGVKTRQQIAKERDEQRRKAVTDKIEAIYTKTKGNVEKKLSTLEADVMGQFDAGMNAALAGMKSWADQQIEKFKDQRYSGIDGKLQWVADLFKPCPDGIKAILGQAKTRFTAEMDALAVKVSTTVDTRLADAKAEVARGQAEVASFVASLPADLRAVGTAAQAEVNGRFQELEAGIDAKKQALAEGLAQKYKEASEKADAELKKKEDENAGALKGFVDKFAGMLKVILEFKAKLMGILRKGWETIKLILADPIGFLGNLLSAVKGGVMAFVGNFQKWLMEGLAKWLFGNLAGAGITMPSDLSLTSIFKLILQLLGITYPNIRAIAVKLVGEPIVKAVEVMAEFVKVFISGGPAALWAHIKEQLSDLKSLVIDAIIGWVKRTIITQAATKLLSMFNPAGAFVQACIAIYNMVMFLVERASQIMAFVEAIINSVHAIATGSIGGAIAWIEKSLGAMVPLVISFLARLIGLGGITAKIIGFIKAVQAKVLKGIEWVLSKIINGLKKLVKGAVSKFGKKDKKDERTPEEKKRDLHAAIGEVQGLMKGPAGDPESVRAKLPALKTKYKLVSLAIVRSGKRYKVAGEVNPKEETIEVPAAVPVPMAISELNGGKKEVSVKTLAEARQVVAGAFPEATESTGPTVESAFPSPAAAATIKKFRALRGKCLQFHVDVQKYDVAVIKAWLEAEIPRAEASVEAWKRDRARVIAATMPAHVLTRASAGLTAASIRVKTLRGFLADWTRLEPQFAALQAEATTGTVGGKPVDLKGVLLGHREVRTKEGSTQHAHRYLAHVNVEGVRLKTGESVKAVIYVVGKV